MDAAFFASLLPADAGVRIEQIRIEPAQVFVDLTTTAAVATCPQCGHTTSVVHSRYTRTLHDQPCLGHPLTLRISARKFRCPTTECSQRIFCERLPGLTAPQARDTGLLRDAHLSIGLALGGEAGARLAERLALPTSADTLLRRVKVTVRSSHVFRARLLWRLSWWGGSRHGESGSGAGAALAGLVE